MKRFYDETDKKLFNRNAFEHINLSLLENSTYAEKFIEFFKSKIDWKFYNYLLHQLTEYEDSGIEVEICIMILDINSGYGTVYKYTSGEGGRFIDLSRYNEFVRKVTYDTDIAAYVKKGLYYNISIGNKSKLNLEFYEKIKDKCIKRSIKEWLVVKPK